MLSDSCVDEDTVLAFIQGSLPDAQASLIERHIDECAECRELVGAAAQEMTSPGQSSPDDELLRATKLPGRIFGRYRVIDLLGYGGMGLVYRAIDVDSRMLVALKTVGVREHGAVASIRREIHALSRVRHAGVVRILEQGIEEGCPWVAMELIEGQTLDSYLEAIRRNAGGPRTPAPTVRAALAVLHKLSATLSHLHGIGLVHRDLTPHNVLIRPDDTPVLVDFGLALESASVGRDVLARAEVAAGTLPYMAPEQILGEPVDARTDLYALGCILYKAVTGQPPFLGESSSALCHQQLYAAPIPPSHLAPGIPAQLEALILRLLKKRPRARHGYADDVTAALSDILADDLGSSARPCDRSMPYVYRPLFSGRDEWIETFDELLDRLRRGKGGLAYVGGESGIGKTRLVAEVAARARNVGLRVVTGEGAMMGAGASESTGKAAALHPLRPLLRAIAEACRDGSLERADRLVGARAKVLSAFEPDLLHLPGQDSHPDPPDLSGQAALHRILSYLQETLAAYAAEAPLLLCLDDLQWADELSLLFLESLKAEFFERHLVLVIGTYRAEEKSAALERLIRAPFVKSISLGRVPSPVVRSMIGDMLALDDAPAQICDLLAKASEGNPFFITEHVRAAVEEGWLEREAHGQWIIARDSALPTPGSLHELMRRRLSALSLPAQHVLEVASVLGLESDGEMILTAAGVEDTEGLEAVQELLTRCVLEEVPHGRLRFAHAKLREAAHEKIPPERRRELHQRAASAIELRSTDGPGATLLYPVLAHHWVSAQVFDKAIPCLEKAGDAALATASYGEAAAFFERALELSRERPGTPEEIERQARWERRLGEAYYALGDLPRCEEHSRAALAGLGHPLPLSRAGWTRMLLAELAVQARHLLRPERPALRSAAQRSALVEAAVTAARVTHSYFFAEDALATLATSLLSVNLIERAGVEAHVARPYAQLGYLAGALHLHPLAGTYFTQARSIADATADPGELAVALYTEATYQLWNGAGVEAHATAERALGLLGTITNPQETEIVEVILAHVDYYLGRYESSSAHCSTLRSSARARDNVQHEAWALINEGRILIRLGRFDAARDRLIQTQDLLRRQSDRVSEFTCIGLLGLAHLHLGELDSAERIADRAIALVGRSTPTVFTMGDGYGAAAEVYLELWRRGRMAPALARKIARAWEALGRFAFVFRFGRPSFLLCTGRIQAALGLTRRAAWLFQRAIAEAHQIGMPFEEALGQKQLGELPDIDPDARAEHCARAKAIFARLGCAHLLTGDLK